MAESEREYDENFRSRIKDYDGDTPDSQLKEAQTRMEANVAKLLSTVESIWADVSALKASVSAGAASHSSPAPEITQVQTDIALLKSCVFPLDQWPDTLVPFWPVFPEFQGSRFTLLLRGSRDGFRATDFHRCCDGHANTMTLITDTSGNIFGGFTPVD
jgi:hypothetical protein